MSTQPLTSLTAGTPLVFGGDRVTHVSEELAAAFSPGDAIVVLQDSGQVLHVPAADRAAAARAVDAASHAFESMGQITDGDLERFFEAFASRLEDDRSFAPIATANAEDVERARTRGRSVTRLILSDGMRADMVAGLRTWAALPSSRGQVVQELEHDGWRLERFRDRLGVVAFVFEGRPNVFADACGVLRGGNTVVFRIGSDALGTARAIVEHALDPALQEAGLPPGAASLVDAPSHAAGWALFGDTRLALAVARGSGAAVSQLGAVAQQVGNPVSLHGTGGAWMVAAATADADRFAAAVRHSLDRKVCNTLNTCCIVRERVDDLLPVFLEALEAAGTVRGTNPKLHVRDTDRAQVPSAWFDDVVPIARAAGSSDEPRAELIETSRLGVEWEWEDSPEVTLIVVDDVDEAAALFNRYSPHFVLSLLSEDAAERSQVEGSVDAPFVGDGFTRWVDGQYALGTPELGLSNWQLGRLLGRSGILSGDGIYTERVRAVQHDPDVHR
jgi:glutamate-5-semialdehyde dehydrogenase